MKNLALYGLQALVGLVAVLAGYAALSGASSVAQMFDVIGLGHGARAVFGLIEIAAGLFLMFPRSGLVGAALLTCAVVAICGVAIGHAMSQPVPSGAALTYRAVDVPGQHFAMPGAAGSANREWRI
jgi:hypothetical protein